MDQHSTIPHLVTTASMVTAVWFANLEEGMRFIASLVAIVVGCCAIYNYVRNWRKK